MTSSEAPALALVSTGPGRDGEDRTLAQGWGLGPLWHRQRRSAEGEGASMEEILLRTPSRRGAFWWLGGGEPCMSG